MFCNLFYLGGGGRKEGLSFDPQNIIPISFSTILSSFPPLIIPQLLERVVCTHQLEKNNHADRPHFKFMITKLRWGFMAAQKSDYVSLFHVLSHSPGGLIIPSLSSDLQHFLL